MALSAGTPFQVNTSVATLDVMDVDILDANNSITVFNGNTNAHARVVQDDETLGNEFSFGFIGSGGVGTIAVAGLSATKALSVRQTGGVKARVLSISGTTVSAPGADEDLGGDSANGISVVSLSSSACIAVYADDLNNDRGRGKYVTISGNTATQESSVTFEASAGNGIGNRTALCKLSSTKACVVYRDEDDSNQLKAIVLSVSGVTISAGSPTIIDAGDAGNYPVLAPISSTSCLLAYRNETDSDIKAVVLSGMSGTSVTVNTPIIVEGNDGTGVGLAAFSATQFVATYSDIGSSDGRMIELAVSGVTVSTSGSDIQFDAGGADEGACATFSSSLAINIYGGTVEAVIITLSADALGLAAMTKPADIDAAGEFIYVALLEGGTPILTKISTALNADGVTVFDPGAGDNIGVECGRFNSDVIWVVGNFDGTNVIEKSEDGGSTFVVKDDATIGDVRAFVMGPDSDLKLLVFDETNGDILETINNGETWTSINASVTPEINAIARLGENTQETVFGNDGAANDNLNYSVNSGDDLEDFNLPVNQNVTKVIVN
jgi:hypothetical protein